MAEEGQDGHSACLSGYRILMKTLLECSQSSHGRPGSSESRFLMTEEGVNVLVQAASSHAA